MTIDFVFMRSIYTLPEQGQLFSDDCFKRFARNALVASFEISFLRSGESFAALASPPRLAPCLLITLAALVSLTLGFDMAGACTFNLARARTNTLPVQG